MTMLTGTGGSVRYPVVTWSARKKAIAMAVAAYLRRHPEGDEIYDVKVEDLGPVARDAHGAMVLERNDLIDRSEF